MRALEVKIGTGKSIRHFQQRKVAERDFDIIKVGLELPKEQLHRNIHSRVDDMIRQDLVSEVESLRSFRSLPALRTVGYTEVFDYIDGLIPLERAIERIKMNTRHYAKRQLTWFKKDQSFAWFSPFDKEAIRAWCGKDVRN
jgi:tRNA dimethylallyltransferase